MLLFIISSTIAVSLISLVGVITLSLNEKTLKNILFYLIALSIGGLMGGAFLHLIPEAIGQLGDDFAFLSILGGFFLFLMIEKIIHWRHCHEGNCPVHTFAYMNLIGDSVHNFIDGLIIAGSFLVSPVIGFTSTAAVILHEIPQEIGDFGVLVYGGISRKKALLMNFLTALFAVAGGVIGFYFLSATQFLSGPLLAFAAGGFIYIAATDLVPEISKETKIGKTFLNLGIIFLGIATMYLLKFIEA